MEIRPGGGGRPAGRVKRAVFVARAELRVGVHANALALVTGDAERLRTMAGRAVGLAAPCVDRVGQGVVAGVKVHRLDAPLVAGHALAAIVTGGARRADLTSLLGVVVREARAMRVAEPVVGRDQRAVLEAGLDEAAELG